MIFAPGRSRFLAVIVITLGCLLAPGVSSAFEARFENQETDARTVPWNTVGRIAMEAGQFPPLYRPVTNAELGRFLILPAEVTDSAERATADWWRARYLLAGGGQSWTGCECKVHPYSLRLQGRIITGYSGLGDVLPGEAGMAWAPGWNAGFEPVVDWSAGVFWATVTGRLAGRVAPGGESFSGDEAITWPGWSIPTGRAQVRDARLSDGTWMVDFPQLLVGAQLGNWSLTGGWASRRTGPGLSGALVMDYTGASHPTLTARRTSPFRWSGFMGFVAPDNLVMRAGQLSERTVDFRDSFGNQEITASPWFFQWLLGWEVTSWFRMTFTHTAMATAREGTLWPDLIQINFPLIGTTWREQESGPVTDRLFAAQMEFRWRHAPWPLLPAQAGRLFWDYAGTDFLPSGPGGLIPQISVPASVAGFELVSPRWDLGFEYAETVHDQVLWYSNSGYDEGYSHRGWLLAHPMGGAAEALTGLVRIRPRGWAVEAELTASHATWAHPQRISGTGERNAVSIGVGKRPGLSAADARLGDQELAALSPLLWQVTAEYTEEIASPKNELGESRRWWRVYLKLGI